MNINEFLSALFFSSFSFFVLLTKWDFRSAGSDSHRLTRDFAAKAHDTLARPKRVGLGVKASRRSFYTSDRCRRLSFSCGRCYCSAAAASGDAYVLVCIQPVKHARLRQSNGSILVTKTTRDQRHSRLCFALGFSMCVKSMFHSIYERHIRRDRKSTMLHEF